MCRAALPSHALGGRDAECGAPGAGSAGWDALCCWAVVLGTFLCTQCTATRLKVHQAVMTPLHVELPVIVCVLGFHQAQKPLLFLLPSDINVLGAAKSWDTADQRMNSVLWDGLGNCLF